jgi:hypothetical protein
VAPGQTRRVNALVTLIFDLSQHRRPVAQVHARSTEGGRQIHQVHTDRDPARLSTDAPWATQALTAAALAGAAATLASVRDRNIPCLQGGVTQSTDSAGYAWAGTGAPNDLPRRAGGALDTPPDDTRNRG